MIADRQPKVYRKDLWPNVSITSLYLRVNQAIRYLTDPENGMDPADRYKIWLEDVKIGYIPRRGYPKIGVSMSFDEVLEGAEPRAETYIGEADMPIWKIKMDDWLEDNEQQEPFHVSNLLLTPQQQEQIRLELGGLENIAFSVSSREIKIIKS